MAESSVARACRLTIIVISKLRASRATVRIVETWLLTGLELRKIEHFVFSIVEIPTIDCTDKNTRTDRRPHLIG